MQSHPYCVNNFMLSTGGRYQSISVPPLQNLGDMNPLQVYEWLINKGLFNREKTQRYADTLLDNNVDGMEILRICAWTFRNKYNFDPYDGTRLRNYIALNCM